MASLVGSRVASRDEESNNANLWPKIHDSLSNGAISGPTKLAKKSPKEIQSIERAEN